MKTRVLVAMFLVALSRFDPAAAATSRAVSLDDYQIANRAATDKRIRTIRHREARAKKQRATIAAAAKCGPSDGAQMAARSIFPDPPAAPQQISAPPLDGPTPNEITRAAFRALDWPKLPVERPGKPQFWPIGIMILGVFAFVGAFWWIIALAHHAREREAEKRRSAPRSGTVIWLNGNRRRIA